MHPCPPVRGCYAPAMTTLTLPRWWDLHAHFRQGDLIAPLVRAHRAMGCAGFVAMPNTAPPVARVLEDDPGDAWSIEAYARMFRDAGAGDMEAIVPLYLTTATTPAMVERGAAEGALRAAKYYPPHGTTGAGAAADVQTYFDNGVFAAMEAADLVLCVHGEAHDVADADYFSRATNAEEAFYREIAPRIVECHPKLRMVAEHVTTAVAADFVRQAGPRVGATVTPQHLLYTTGHLLRGLKHHLYCLPVVKFAEDRAALRDLVRTHPTAFAGTDSAPHATKMTACGCAAGCYTGGVAPQLYAMAFEEAGARLDKAEDAAAFRAFLCERGPAFWGLPVPKDTFTLERREASVAPLPTPQGPITPLPLGVGMQTLPWAIA
jgi:dihydroorotase